MRRLIKRGINRLSGSRIGMSVRRRIIVTFAKKYNLTYFQSVNPEGFDLPVIRGSTLRPEHSDRNYCIGPHAGYDVSFVERTARVSFKDYKPSLHKWYVLQIDLKHADNLPYIFIGTHQQTKAYYAGLLASHRQLEHLMLDTDSPKSAKFHSNYVVLSSPAAIWAITNIFDDMTIDSMATHHYPFSVEIEADSIIITTDAEKPSLQLMDKLLHFGLWFAKHLDSRLS